MIIFAIIFYITVGILFSQSNWPIELIYVYLVINIITLLVYRFDKFAATTNRWRVKESTLQLLSLFGGWTGALIAQRVFRHKNSKESFQKVYLLAVACHCVVLAVILLYMFFFA